MAGRDIPKGNAAIGQSGGPTAVINQSMVACATALKKLPRVKKILGMRHGVNGLVKGQFVDLGRVNVEQLKKIAASPAAALGSSRDKPDAEYCERIVSTCRERDIRYFFYIGGNDSSLTCHIVNELAEKSGYDMRCFHIPKTVDNDLMESDHTPGYPSAARFVATAFMADSLDNASLPGVKINVVMGRHAGFLTAAAALARGEGKKEQDSNTTDGGPHLIYLPEVPFDRNLFLADVERVYARLGRCQIAVSEGVQNAAGEPMATTLVQGLDRDAHGNVQLSGVGALGDALADLVKKNIQGSGGSALRVRADTFGYLQRCWPDPSPVDSKDARDAATFAVKLAARGERSGSVAIVRKKGKAYASEMKKVELSAVAGKTRHMPAEFIDGTNNVSRAFVAYCRPLVGKLPTMARL